MNAAPSLDTLLDRGLVADIFRMERAFSLLEAIGTNAERLNSREAGNFGELFGAIQTALTSECVLAAARLFDRPHPRFPTRCLRYTLNYLRENASELPAIRERYQLGRTLSAARLDTLIPAIELGSRAFAMAVVEHYESILQNPNVSATLEALKSLRDKAIAHNEHVDVVTGPTWIELNNLIAHAKFLVGILGWAWIGTVYDMSGDFILTADAVRPQRAFNRLIERLYQSTSS